MNVVMREVKFVDPVGRKRQFEDFFVASRLIRFVQIPTHIDIKQGLKNLNGKKAF